MPPPAPAARALPVRAMAQQPVGVLPQARSARAAELQPECVWEDDAPVARVLDEVMAQVCPAPARLVAWAGFVCAGCLLRREQQPFQFAPPLPAAMVGRSALAAFGELCHPLAPRTSATQQTPSPLLPPLRQEPVPPATGRPAASSLHEPAAVASLPRARRVTVGHIGIPPHARGDKHPPPPDSVRKTADAGAPSGVSRALCHPRTGRGSTLPIGTEAVSW